MVEWGELGTPTESGDTQKDKIISPIIISLWSGIEKINYKIWIILEKVVHFNQNKINMKYNFIKGSCKT